MPSSHLRRCAHNAFRVTIGPAYARAVADTLVSQLRALSAHVSSMSSTWASGSHGERRFSPSTTSCSALDAEQRRLPAEHVRVALAMQHVQRPRRELHPLQPDQPAREPRRAQRGVERVARHHPTDLRVGLKLTLEGLKRIGRQDGVGVDAEQVVIAIGDVLPPRQRQGADLAVLVADRLDHRHPPPEADARSGPSYPCSYRRPRPPGPGAASAPAAPGSSSRSCPARYAPGSPPRPSPSRVFGGRCCNRCSASCAASITRLTRAAKRSASGVPCRLRRRRPIHHQLRARGLRLRRGRGLRAGEPTPRRIRTPHPHRTRTSTLRAPEPPRRNLRLDLGLSRSGHDQQPGVKTPNPHEPNPHTTPARTRTPTQNPAPT